MFLFKIIIMVICLRAKPNFFNDYLGGFGFHYLLPFLLFVKKLFVIDYLTYWWIGVWGNLHQIQFQFFGFCYGILKRINSHFNIVAYQPNIG